MQTNTVVVGVCLNGSDALPLEAFARACGSDAQTVLQLVDEGLLAPAATQPEWRFDGQALARVHSIMRLQRDFEANLQSVAVMLDLMDEVQRLRGWLHREGIRVPETL